MSAFDFLKWDDVLLRLIEEIEHRSDSWEKILMSKPAIVLRSWQGKISLCLPCTRGDFLRVGLSTWSLEFGRSLGLLSSGEDVILCADELVDPEDIWGSPDLVPLSSNSALTLKLLDRQDKEGDWLRQIPTSTSNSVCPRAVFFGVKGGVGRSSALTALAIHLANKGKKVLVIDADFESPGISSSLLGPERPDFGLVDWMTAHSLGCPEDQLSEMATDSLVEISPLSQGTNGRILVAPAHSKLTQAYIAKLGRLYRTTNEGVSFAQRMNKLVTMLEQIHEVNVTLIDSRAGIDDTAAAAVTQLEARVTFLFAINTAQTWDAYRLLFSHLQRHPSLHTVDDFRPSLRMVSALTPEEVGAYKGYWNDFQQKAYDTCMTLYDDDNGSGDPTIFSPAPNDEDSPHFAARVMWHEVLRAFAPLEEKGQLGRVLMESVFGNFLAGAEALLGDS